MCVLRLILFQVYRFRQRPFHGSIFCFQVKPSSMASNSSFPIDSQHVSVDTRWLTEILDENSRRHVPRILQSLSDNLVETTEDLRHLEKTEVSYPRWLLCPFCNLLVVTGLERLRGTATDCCPIATCNQSPLSQDPTRRSRSRLRRFDFL